MPVHAAVLVIGAYGTLVSSRGSDPVPPLMSLFGVIHFESKVFAPGTTAFLFALVKKRGETAAALAV
jgi:hypothetical protein